MGEYREGRPPAERDLHHLRESDVDADPSAPDDVIRRAISLFSRRPGRRARTHPLPLPRVDADLILDSRDRPVPAGVRGGLRLERQLLFSVAGFDIDLRLSPDDTPVVRCHGQILPESGGFLGPDRLQVYLRTGDDEVQSLAVTEFGEFSAVELGSGEQTLELLLDEDVCYRLSFRV
jgi:hypothetical protein